MKAIFRTRLLHWKRQKITLLFWLFLPTILTLSIIALTETTQGEAKIPVGIVLQEETEGVLHLLDELQNIRVLQIEVMTEEEALHQIENHTLDSAFIIKEGYMKKINAGSRNRLITGFRSDLSFAYTPVSESIQSIVQQETGRLKAAFTVQELSASYDSDTNWSTEEIVDKSKEVEKQENLLQTEFNFTYKDRSSTEDEISLWNPWGLWAIFSVLSTLLLFDWLIKEKNSSVTIRFFYTRFSFKSYALATILIYFWLFLLVDLGTASLFYHFLDLSISIRFLISLVILRIILLLGAFLVALLFRNVYLYYVFSFALTLFIAITSGVILPIDGIVERVPALSSLHPLYPFLNDKLSLFWTGLLTICIILWFGRKEKPHAHH